MVLGGRVRDEPAQDEHGGGDRGVGGGPVVGGLVPRGRAPAFGLEPGDDGLGGGRIGPAGSGEWITPNQAAAAGQGERRRGGPDPAVDQVRQRRRPRAGSSR